MSRRVVAGEVTGRDDEKTSAEVAALRLLSLAELRQRWRGVGGGSLPKTLPTFLVLRLLACKLQARHSGDISPDLRKALIRRGRGEAVALPLPGTDRTAPRALAVGTLLTREWAGRAQQVMVLADGFAWNSQTFGSLSEVARAITGTRWSGPVFFGLKGKGKKGGVIAPKDRASRAKPAIDARAAIVGPIKQSRASSEVGRVQ